MNRDLIVLRQLEAVFRKLLFACLSVFGVYRRNGLYDFKVHVLDFAFLLFVVLVAELGKGMGGLTGLRDEGIVKRADVLHICIKPIKILVRILFCLRED